MKNTSFLGLGIAFALLGVSLFALGFMMWSNSKTSVSQLSLPPSISPTPSPEEITHRTTFLAVGDIMLSRGVDQAIRKNKNPLLPFEKLAPVFEEADFSFGNFESPINGTEFAGKNGSLVFNTPIKNLEGLKKYKFEIVTLANNHALDQGEKGLRSTEQFLHEAGIQTVGTGNTIEDAWNAKIISKNGIRIAFIGASYASYNDNGSKKNEWVARIEDRDLLKNAIAQAKTSADFVIVAPHAGVEYTRNPNQAQIDFAHTAIDFGADMIIGSHPHWIQITEEYKGKMIFYSLGNFIFDQEWSKDTKEGMMLHITATKKGQEKKLETSYIPVIIENYSTPRMANEEEKKNILKKIRVEETK